MVYDVIVVGGGAAGMTAALYALRNGKAVMILEKEGFKVRAYLHGLGENPEMRKLYVARANEAWDVLQAK